MTNLPPAQAVSVVWAGETVLVSNVERSLPEAPTGDDRVDTVSAGTANPATPLPADAWHAVARAVVTPGAAALQLRPSKAAPHGLLMEEHVEGATLRSLPSKAWLHELFPGIQPRTGMEIMPVADPRVEGVTADDRPTTLLRYVYPTLSTLKEHVWQTIQGTLAANSYAPSILSRKVTRQLITHPVEFAFEDGTESFYGLVVRDGITRLASAWQVLAGPGASAAEAADTAAEALFGSSAPVPSGEGKPLTQRMAAGREARRRALAAQFAGDWAGDRPGLRAIQIAQTYTVPTQIMVGAQQHAGSGPTLAPVDLFDDAMRSILASVHLEFKEWDSAAQNVEVATRALKRVMQIGLGGWPKEDLLTIYGLAVGRTEPEDLPRVFENQSIPGTALWRGVYLVHAFTHPELFGLLKQQAKAIKGVRRMDDRAFAALLGPIVDFAWRDPKREATKQARNAWSNGGVLSKDVLEREWDPVPTADFASLVEPALKGDDDARCTLAVAGGIALIADKLLTRNVGSALMAPKDKGGVPFRANVNDVIGSLARPGNETGLWTLALAAQRFEAHHLPRNPATSRQLIPKAAASTGQDYVHVVVDLSAPDRIARDETDQPVALTQWDVCWAADRDRAHKEVQRATPFAASAVRAPGPAPASDPVPLPSFSHPDQGAAATPAGVALTPSHRAALELQTLKNALDDAHQALDALAELEPKLGTWPPLFPTDELEGLHTVAQELKHALYQRLKEQQDSAEQEAEEQAEVEVDAEAEAEADE
ncbi:hypothetical protein ACWCQL_24725 [Streptomyces sp. NPDC002073]